MLKILLVANQVIVVFGLPERSASSRDCIRFLRRERFPRMMNIAKSIRSEWLNNDVYVIGHDAPCIESVSFFMKMHESVCNDFGNAWQCKKTGSVSFVQQSIEPQVEPPDDGKFLRCQIPLEHFRGTDDVMSFSHPLAHFRLRNRVSQP